MLSTYRSAPGYRDVSLTVKAGATANTEVDLRLSAKDCEAVMHHIQSVREVSWRQGQPLELVQGETRPRWLERVSAR
jgi:hypothetical protein